MTLGYVYMILSLTCFGLIGIFIKFGETRGCKPRALSTLAYGWALLFAFLLMVYQGSHFDAPRAVYLIALPFGVASVIGVIVFMMGVRFGKISTSWLVISLSAAVPAIGSVVLYHEPVKPKKIAVLALAVVSILLLWKDKQDDEAKSMDSGNVARENA
jgi:drug/metabolite transporter (DMT)-like permease